MRGRGRVPRGARGRVPLPLGPDGARQVSIDAYGPLPAEASFEAPLAALFAPDDPVVTVELAGIQTVRDARLDPNDYAEGENPFRIRYARLQPPEPGDRGRARRCPRTRGVDVQILDADQLDPARDYNVAARRSWRAASSS
ncbi:MAG: hypothetical protein R3B82_23745 [Sandaracinaceae bacterium]